MPTPQGHRPPPTQGKGLVYHTIRLLKGDDRALLGLWRGEAEKTGHSEVSGVKGGVEWNERGEVGVLLSQCDVEKYFGFRIVEIKVYLKVIDCFLASIQLTYTMQNE